MVLPLSKRREYFQSLLLQKPIGFKDIWYKGETQNLPIYGIDPRYLIYNIHNGRLETEVMTWRAEEKSAPEDAYDEKVHKKVEDFLWNTNIYRNQRTKDDIELKGQLEPGIVTVDGVIVDGNRRAMLLSKINRHVFKAVVLKDVYDENVEDIVRLETMYQLGQDTKLDYGPLEKYLHAKRLVRELDIDPQEVAVLMGGTSKTEVERLLRIMDLMDSYLAHIGCEGLYNMLKERDGSTKEGAFVDFEVDWRRLNGSTGNITWPYDKDVDLPQLQSIIFDHIRAGQDFMGEKSYRYISHGGGGKRSFFAYRDIWEGFAKMHQQRIDPVTAEQPTLEQFCKENPQHPSKVAAARELEAQWNREVDADLKKNFGITTDKLENRLDQSEPNRLLQKALNALNEIDYRANNFTECADLELIKAINSIAYEMKRRFDRKA